MSPQAADSRRCGVGGLAHLRRLVVFGAASGKGPMPGLTAEDQACFYSPHHFGGPVGPRRRWGRRRNEKSSSESSAVVALTIRLANWSSSWRSSSGRDTALSTIDATNSRSTAAPK